MSDPRQKTDMSDELTTIARKSYGESAFVVRISPGFMLYVERKPVWYHEGASQEEAFRELKLKLETMAMLTELQNAKRAAEAKKMDAEKAEFSALLNEANSIATRVYGDGMSIHVQRYSGNGDCWVAEVRRGNLIVIKGKRSDFAANGEGMQTARIDAAKDLLVSLRSLEVMHAPSIMQAETKRMVDEFAAQARRAYGPTAETEFSPLERTFGVLVNGMRVIEERGATVRDAFERAMDRVVMESRRQITREMRREFIDIAHRLYPGSIALTDARKCEFSVTRTDGTPIVSETGATMLDAYDAVMARLRAEAAKTVAASEATALTERTTGTMFPHGPGYPTMFLAGLGVLPTMPPKSTQQKAPMTTPTPTAPTIAQTLTADAEAAAWMLAGSQFVKLTKEPIVALLSRHLGPGDDSLRARIAAFLDTELGTAIVAAILSGGLSAMPAPAGSQAASINARLARELRVKSMATVGDAAVDLIAGPMRQVISLYIAGAPAFPMGLPDGADRIVVPSTAEATVAR